MFAFIAVNHTTLRHLLSFSFFALRAASCFASSSLMLFAPLVLEFTHFLSWEMRRIPENKG